MSNKLGFNWDRVANGPLGEITDKAISDYAANGRYGVKYQQRLASGRGLVFMTEHRTGNGDHISYFRTSKYLGGNKKKVARPLARGVSKPAESIADDYMAMIGVKK